MVSVIKLVDGKVEAQQPVSSGCVADAVERRTGGLNRGQEVIRGMEWALRTAGVPFRGDTFSTSLRIGDSVFRIAMRESMDSPWLAWSNGDWRDPI